jgi:hypothetical protein
LPAAFLIAMTVAAVVVVKKRLAKFHGLFLLMYSML